MLAGSRIAMLPKQRYKQEQRLMLLNADSIVNTYPQRQLQRTAAGTVKRNCSSQSTEEGFDESFSEDDELLILPLGPPNDAHPLLATQVFLPVYLLEILNTHSLTCSLRFICANLPFSKDKINQQNEIRILTQEENLI